MTVIDFFLRGQSMANDGPNHFSRNHAISRTARRDIWCRTRYLASKLRDRRVDAKSRVLRRQFPSSYNANNLAVSKGLRSPVALPLH